MRALGLALVASVLFLAGIQPAAASSTPSKVGLVSFVAASYSPSSHTASLTIDWPNTSHATKYEIFMSRHSSMSLAKKYNSISSTKRFAGLVPGGNYFFQVRGVNGSQAGSKSNRVGHTATRDQGSASGPTYRVMTYNVCSRVCDEKQTTKYSWARRQPPAFERVATYKPDVLAAQEADNLDAPPGYTRALYKSGKKLFYKTNRFDLATGSVPDSQSCGDTQPPQQPVNGPRTGFVCLGIDGGGARYAVWAELVDKTTNRHVLFVDVHTVTGDSEARAVDREGEIRTLFKAMATINPASALPVVFAGDFNSHKNRPNDYLASIFHTKGYYDAYDLAMKLTRQHYNSYNDFSVIPKISYTWGDHVDHVWVIPSKTRVLGWRNAALIVNGRMSGIIPSDHSPLVIDVQVN